MIRFRSFKNGVSVFSKWHQFYNHFTIKVFYNFLDYFFNSDRFDWRRRFFRKRSFHCDIFSNSSFSETVSCTICSVFILLSTFSKLHMSNFVGILFISFTKSYPKFSLMPYTLFLSLFYRGNNFLDIFMLICYALLSFERVQLLFQIQATNYNLLLIDYIFDCMLLRIDRYHGFVRSDRLQQRFIVLLVRTRFDIISLWNFIRRNSDCCNDNCKFHFFKFPRKFLVSQRTGLYYSIIQC